MAILGGLENQPVILEQRGLPVRSLPYVDMGVNTMGLAIIASRETQQSRADLVRRFVKATREAFEAAERDPEASVQAGLHAKPDMDHGCYRLEHVQTKTAFHG